MLDLDETLVHSSFKPIPDPDYIIPVEIEGKVGRHAAAEFSQGRLSRDWRGSGDSNLNAAAGPRVPCCSLHAAL